MPQAAVDVTGFLTMMAALSAAVQTLVEHVVKKQVTWLDETNPDKNKDKRRHVAIHGIAFLLGGAIRAFKKAQEDLKGAQRGGRPA